MKVYKTKIKEIDNINTSYYDKNDNLIRVPHKISEEEISKLFIVKWECLFGGYNYSILVKENPTEYIVCENRPTEDRAIWEYFWRKLNEIKMSTFNVKK
jgi:hypothetical protein